MKKTFDEQPEAIVEVAVEVVKVLAATYLHLSYPISTKVKYF